MLLTVVDTALCAAVIPPEMSGDDRIECANSVLWALQKLLERGRAADAELADALRAPELMAEVLLVGGHRAFQDPLHC